MAWKLHKLIHNHTPALSTAHGDYVIFYYKPIPKEDLKMKALRVLWNRHMKSALTIEVFVPSYYSLNQAERETNNKY